MKRRQDRSPTEPPAPGTITGIDAQVRDNARLNIAIDGKFAFGLHADIVLEHYLHIGQQLSAETITQLLREDEIKKATMAALNLIAYRPRASGELLQKLREKGHSVESAESAVSRMQALGYVNDVHFAERWVENRLEHRPRSRTLLKQELRAKGIDQDTITEVMADTEIDEVADALTLATKKAASMMQLDQETRHRRLSGFLARRGYGFDVIRKVLDQIG